ncbi:MAG: DUF4221 family protein [Bacteroidales bacterium]|nr:DUF4221 family protein [Bacteroidales bacterium]MCI6801439.1 DUF4221 family protein [Bacteroidales bacterium]MCI6900481.1 DUF4221 family protein [Bacteroidales bacterium]
MKNLLHFILSIFVFTSFLGCSSDVVKTPDEFLKQENVLPQSNWKEQVIADIGGSEKILFLTQNRDALCSLELETKKIDTLYAGYDLYDVCVNEDDGSVWLSMGNWEKMWYSKTNTKIQCPPIKHHDKLVRWEGSPQQSFFACGNRLFTGVMPKRGSTNSDLDYAGFREKSSLIAEWDISDVNNIKCVKIFGKRPSDQPKDMFVDDYYYTAFNVEDSVIVAATELSQRVVVMNFKGEKLKEKKLSSVFYVPPEKKDFSQNHSAIDKINYWNSNMLFRGLYYDKYRKLYYRLLVLSGEKSENTFTKKEADWVLIVADSKLRKKYEVRFDSNKYSWGSVLIGKQGVYVRNKKDKTFDLFVFD